MQNKISTTDLYILTTIFFPKTERIVVYDPKHKLESNQSKIHNLFSDYDELNVDQLNKASFVLINLSDDIFPDHIKFSKQEGLIDFSGITAEASSGFYYLNNPDGTMRWIYTANGTTPVFLNLYNGSGLKAKLFNAVTKLLYRFRSQRLLSNGEFSVSYCNGKTLYDQIEEVEFDDYAIFTGTVGENRKAILSLSKDKQCECFVKVPLTYAARELVNHEYQELQQLATMGLTEIKIPKAKVIDQGVVVSNVKPASEINNNHWTDNHWRAIGDLYAQTAEQNVLTATSVWNSIQDGLVHLKENEGKRNGLSKAKIDAIENLVQDIIEKIDASSVQTIAYAHGDFTPWNMYATKNKLFVYDWELCIPDAPLLFDVFHYFFQKGILVDRKNFSTIYEEIHQHFKSTLARNIINQYNIEWKQNLQIYLSYISCYYLPKYMRQPELHTQVHWLVKVWEEALEVFVLKLDMELH